MLIREISTPNFNNLQVQNNNQKNLRANQPFLSYSSSDVFTRTAFTGRADGSQEAAKFPKEIVRQLLVGPDKRKMKEILPILEQINTLAPKFASMSDEQLQEQTQKFKDILAKRPVSTDPQKDMKLEYEALNKILPEAFAVVREATKRVLDKRLYNVQLAGGIFLHKGDIAEMQTGEGKTLVAALPAYLNALTGKGVHVITVNDYLAKRDHKNMSRVYEFLGLSTGVIVSDKDSKIKKNEAEIAEKKKAAYACDITYGTNYELGFDYLRDNMVKKPEQRVQRPYNFAIIDEADSILIDEARTPLIISHNLDKSSELYEAATKVSLELKRDIDYEVDNEKKNVVLTDRGINKAEKILNVEDLYDVEHQSIHYLMQALRAKELYRKDVDYIVENGELVIVNELTGRPVPGRKWSDGLHQAVQAKEGLKIEDEIQTLASVTFQNFFRLYPKLSGMTGTAATEKSEFEKTYNLEVVSVPTNKPNIRIDLPDVIYTTEKQKYSAVVDEISEMHKQGRPVLVGTISIDKSEYVSKLLRKEGIEHNVLNAKSHEQEAYIIAQAGRPGAVTVATNMAGRGTDILLGGNSEYYTEEYLQGRGYSPESTPDYKAKKHEVYTAAKNLTEEEHKKVVALGGLHVIGTERHESRRIDNQLRGRAARQGDPGSAKFFISLEDNLMKRFGGQNASGSMERMNAFGTAALESSLAARHVEKCQKKAEGANFDRRKTLLQYDAVMNTQRKMFYQQRAEVLQGKDLSETIFNMIEQEVTKIISSHITPDARGYKPEDLDGLIKEVHSIMPQLSHLEVEDIKGLEFDAIFKIIRNFAFKAYKKQEKEDAACVLLKIADSEWKNHLSNLEELRNGIGLRSYGQKNPLTEYIREAYDLFDNMNSEIRSKTVKSLFSSLNPI